MSEPVPTSRFQKLRKWIFSQGVKRDPSEKAPCITKVRAIVCGMMVNLLIGTYYNYSNINPYIAKYFKTDSSNTIVASQIWLMSQSLTKISSVNIADFTGWWFLNLLAFLSLSLLNYLVSFIENWVAFILVYGILCGVTIGMGYLAALYISWSYFPDHKSLATGSLLLFAGLSASILSPISTMIVNPDNLKPSNPGYGERVPILFRYLAIIFGTVALIGTLLQPFPWRVHELPEEKAARIKAEQAPRGEAHTNLLSDRKNKYGAQDPETPERLKLPEAEEQIAAEKKVLNEPGTAELEAELGPTGDKDIKEYRQAHHLDVEVVKPSLPNIAEENLQGAHIEAPKTEEANKPKSSETESKKEIVRQECPDVKTAMTTHYFYLLIAMAFCSSIYNYFLNSNWKDYYIDMLPDVSDSNLALCLSFGAFANSGMKFFTGVILLKVYYKYVLIAQLVMGAFAAFSFMSIMHSYWVGVILLMMALAGIGIETTLFPYACTIIFGTPVGSKVYPYIYLTFSTANFAQYFIYKFYGKTQNRTGMFYLFGVFPLIGIGLTLLLNTHPDWKTITETKAQKARLKAAQNQKQQGVGRADSASKKDQAPAEGLVVEVKQPTKEN